MSTVVPARGAKRSPLVPSNCVVVSICAYESSYVEAFMSCLVFGGVKKITLVL